MPSYDERKWSTSNREFHPSLQHKIRIIAKDNKKRNVYGTTIPRVIAQQFINCMMSISVSGNMIILESGCETNKTLEIKNGENILVIR